MATITASLERSLQNCSLNQTTTTRSRRAPRSTLPETPNHNHHHHHDNQSVLYSNASSSDDNSAFVDLNSHVSLPYHWEQCLDLKTGEIYYINWSNGMKAKEDPRTLVGGGNSSYYSEEENESNGGVGGYDSEGSSTESSSSSSSSPSSSTSTRESFRSMKSKVAPAAAITHQVYGHDNEDEDDQGGVEEVSSGSDSILVVAGCKACLMYYMVPKHVQDCPKCCAHLLHFPPNHKPS